MVGQPPDRLCLTMTAAFLTSISARHAIGSFLQQSSDGSSFELALGYAACQGFPKMLIHRWYRMLRPSAWLSWDTKLAQISRALFSHKAPQLKIKLTFFLWVCSAVFLKITTFVPVFTHICAAVQKYFEQHRLTGFNAFGNQGVVNCKSLWRQLSNIL